MIDSGHALRSEQGRDLHGHLIVRLRAAAAGLGRQAHSAVGGHFIEHVLGERAAANIAGADENDLLRFLKWRHDRNRLTMPVVK